MFKATENGKIWGPESAWIILPAALGRQLLLCSVAGLSVGLRVRKSGVLKIPPNMTLTEIGQDSHILGGIFISIVLDCLVMAASPFLLSIPFLWRHGTLFYFTPELGGQRLFIIAMK